MVDLNFLCFIVDLNFIVHDTVTTVHSRIELIFIYMQHKII